MWVSVIQGVRTDELIVEMACSQTANLIFMTGVSPNENKIYSQSLYLVKTLRVPYSLEVGVLTP